MYNPRFEKEAFKKEVTNNVKTLFRRTVDEATPQQLFQAVSYAVKEVIIDDWLATQKKYDEDDPKMVRPIDRVKHASALAADGSTICPWSS